MNQNLTLLDCAIEDLAAEIVINREVRIECDFDAIFRAIYNDMIENEDFDLILDDLIHNFARDVKTKIFESEGFYVHDEIEIATMIALKLGDIAF